MNRFGKILLSSLFIIYIFIIGIYKVLTPDYETSEVENRSLAQKPKFTLESFVDGSYTKDFETYFTDQFPGRNVWLESYIDYQRITNKTYIYDYFVTDTNWIMPKPKYEDEQKSIDASTEKVNEFGKYLKNKGIEFYYFLLPHKATALEFLYPNYIERSSSKENANYFMSQLDPDSVVSIDMDKTFGEFTESELMDMYFQTDHHWNINGAFEGYKIFASTLMNNSDHFEGDDQYLNKDYYALECAEESIPFKGSYNKQIYMSVDSEDNEDMCTLIQKDIFPNYEVFVNGKKVDPFEVYASGLKDEKRDYLQYVHIFSKDIGEIEIINNQNKRAGNILIIKDSYTNPMIYHIAQNFNKTTIYDLRHNEGRTVKEFIDNNDFNVVAILYNSTNLKGSNYDFFKESN